MSQIVTISGSPSSNSRSAAILNYMRAAFERCNLATSAVDVRDFDPADLITGRFDSLQVKQTVTLLSQAEVVVIATPVYKAAYTGALKTLIDLLPQNAFKGKAVLPIASGGTLAHLLMIDYALKPVLSALGAQHILQGIYVQDAQVRIENHQLNFVDSDVEQRLLNAVNDITQLFFRYRPIPADVGGDEPSHVNFY